MPLILLLFLLLIIIGVKVEPRGAWSKPLKYDSTVAIRGICAIEIMIGHIGVETNNKWLFANRKAGILIVGVFFLLSGYGLMYSAFHKADYFKNFLTKRIGVILLPAYLMYIFRLMREIFIYKESVSAGYIIKYIFLMYFPVKLNWYITEIIVLYVLFFILYRNKKYKIANILLILASVVFIVMAGILGLNNPWYGSTMCFSIGILFMQMEEKILEWMRKHYVTAVVVSSIIMAIGIISFFKLGEESYFGNIIGRNIASSAFAILVILILCKITIGNFLSSYLGKISYELFLVHPYIITIISIENPVLFTLVCVAVSVIFAIVLKFISNWIIKLYRTVIISRGCHTK